MTRAAPTAIKLEAAIRPDQHRELAALAETIWRECYADLLSAAQIDYMLANGYSPATLAADQAAGTRLTLARAGDGRALALSAVSPGPDHTDNVWLDKLYVHVDARRCGLARCMLGHACGQAANWDARRLRLRVNRNNARAIAAYQRLGLVIETRHDEAIGHGFVMDDYIMGTAIAAARI